MKYVTSIEKASEWGVTKRMVNYWCALGKITGVYKDGNRWKIPKDAVRPGKDKGLGVVTDYCVYVDGDRVGVGVQDYEKIRMRNLMYVDKTSFIKEWWESGDDVTLITRPRRFGKTLNLSMIECFFSIGYSDRENLFCGLGIWNYEEYRKLQGTYPIIFLSLAGVKADDYKGAMYAIKYAITELFSNIMWKLNIDMKAFSENEQNEYNKINMDMDDDMASLSIRLLSNLLYKYYKKKTIILIDEYDTPIQEAYFSGYWDKMLKFIRSFFNNTFKTNPNIEKALLTGITRVSKESIFSDMNHLEVVTMTSHKYETAFGFTEKETIAALRHTGLEGSFNNVKRWYDGFTIGSCKDIYNPWSIIKFIDSKGRFDAYWANTSANSLVNTLVAKGSKRIKCAMEDLMNDIPISAVINENIDFAGLETDENAVWNLLFTTGYLRIEHMEYDIYKLQLTNKEVKKMFAGMFATWFNRSKGSYASFQEALLKNDIEAMNYYMNMTTMATFSYFDCGSKSGSIEETERFYHGFVLGLMAQLDDKYMITSNRESGIGRYDIMMKAREDAMYSYIIEFKVYDRKKDSSLEDAANRALKQIKDKGYATELIVSGISENMIRSYGFAFMGKEVVIVGEEEESK